MIKIEILGDKSMKTRVAIVLPYFGRGGAENMVSRLASHLDLKRVEAEVICIYGEPQNNILEQNVLQHGVPIKYIRKRKGFSLNALKKLNQELSRFKPQIVHTHLSACVYCVPWISIHRAVMLHTIHNMPSYELIRPKRMIMAMMYKTKKAVPVAISHEIQKLTKELYKCKNNVELVYNPVDIDRFASVPKMSHEEYTLVSVGRLSIQKNQMLLLHAFEQSFLNNQSAQLFILGDGPLREKLEKYIQEKKLKDCVHLEGNVDNVEQYFARADVFVLSSNYEGLPLVILEAMAAGLPIISTNVGGVKDIVKNNGILVKPNAIGSLSNAMKELEANPDLRKQMSIDSRKNVVNYDVNIIADQYLTLYKKYADKK